MLREAARNRWVTLIAGGTRIAFVHDIKVNCEPALRRATNTGAAMTSRKSFRQRYDELETRRFELIARLTMLGDSARQHPAYKRSLKLLNQTFRHGKLAQRLAVLEAATWLIDLLEKLTSLSG